MEPLKILIIIASFVLVYYLITCFIKWYNGETKSEVFKIFYPIKNAYLMNRDLGKKKTNKD
nr:hypothetical protein [uncultured Pedobacter sp.]